jgi:hypothetical protein
LDAPQAASFFDLYDSRYAPHLMGRADSFRIMFQALEARCSEKSGPALIVETGSLHNPGHWADGQSTLLWSEFARFQPCEIHTVDLKPEAASVVREVCGADVRAHTGDSVGFLYEMASVPNPPQIDLLYLDSYDFDPEEPFPSAFHHIKELISARPCLGKGSIIAIDDNFLLPDGQYAGKGYLVMQWFRHLDIKCLYSGYQWVWQL